MYGTITLDLTDMKKLAREGEIEVGTGSEYGTISLELSEGAQEKIADWKRSTR